MKKIIIFGLPLVLLFIFSSKSFAVPGDYTLRLKVGPTFNLNDYENQVKFGGSFDYDLGFGWGVGIEILIGVKNEFLFQLMPNVRYTFLYVGPMEWFIFTGLGYEAFGKDSAMGMKFGSGIALPLGTKWEVMTDFSINITPLGTTGTPTTLDWLLGIGFRFGGGR